MLQMIGWYDVISGVSRVCLQPVSVLFLLRSLRSQILDWGGCRYVTTLSLSRKPFKEIRPPISLSQVSFPEHWCEGPLKGWSQCQMSWQWEGGVMGTTWSSTWAAWGAPASSPTSPPSPPSCSPPTSWGSPVLSFGTRRRGWSPSTILPQSLGFWKGHLGRGRRPPRRCRPPPHHPFQARAGFARCQMTWWSDDKMRSRYNNDLMTWWQNVRITWWHDKHLQVLLLLHLALRHLLRERCLQLSGYFLYFQSFN